MKRKINANMILISLVAILLTTILLSLFTYTRYMNQMRSGIKDETAYMATSLNLHDKQDLDAYKNITISRITLIDKDGTVDYDSQGHEETMSNHKNRQEVKEALEKGYGQATRTSNTFNKQTYYYAVQLDDGNVLRLSRATQTMMGQVAEILPYSLAIMVIVFIVGVLLSRVQTARIVKPINEIDLVNPRKNETYPELSPLLDRIEQQNIDIENQIEEIKAAENMRKEFSANVSHELKTPLTTISGYAELMKNGMVQPEDMERFSSTIHGEAQRLISMIENIIKLSRLDENQVELNKQEIDLYDMAFQIKEDLTYQWEREQVSFHVRGVHTKLCGVYQVLYEMMYNICENAIKYNNPGGKVEFSVTTLDNRPTMIVQDNGMGIPEKDQERIFERFYRADKSHSREKGGSGLGLSIVKHGAQFHDATIDVESKEGEGTRITISFPEII